MIEIIPVVAFGAIFTLVIFWILKQGEFLNEKRHALREWHSQKATP